MDRNTLLNRPSTKSSGFSKYSAVLNEMGKLSWLTLSKNLPFSKGLAFATRLHGDSGVYQIYVSKYANEEERIPLWIHEAGHVLLSHLALNKKQHDTVVSKIMSVWPAISDKVDLTEAIIKSGLTPNEVARNYAKKISHALLNIAMDFEVNSKMFSEEEWLNMKDLTEEVYIRGIASEGSDEEVEKVISILEKGEKVTKPCWPADYSFPLKLNYNQYVDLIIENFEQFINDTMNSGDSDDESSSGECLNRKLTAEEINEFCKQYDDAADNENNINKTVEESIDPTEGDFGREGTGFGRAQKEIDSNKVSEAAVVKFLRKNLLQKKHHESRVDYMHHYNRRRYGESIVSKVKVNEKWEKSNLYLLADCSSSVDEKQIKVLLSAVKKISKEFGKESRIIWWDTQLEGDFLISKMRGPKGLGGTHIATGMKYVNDKYLKPNDKLVVISDYRDGMISWIEVLSNIKCGKAGICWTTNKDDKSVKDITSPFNIEEYIPTMLVHV